MAIISKATVCPFAIDSFKATITFVLSGIAINNVQSILSFFKSTSLHQKGLKGVVSNSFDSMGINYMERQKKKEDLFYLIWYLSDVSVATIRIESSTGKKHEESFGIFFQKLVSRPAEPHFVRIS